MVKSRDQHFICVPNLTSGKDQVWSFTWKSWYGSESDLQSWLQLKIWDFRRNDSNRANIHISSIIFVLQNWPTTCRTLTYKFWYQYKDEMFIAKVLGTLWWYSGLSQYFSFWYTSTKIIPVYDFKNSLDLWSLY